MLQSNSFAQKSRECGQYFIYKRQRFFLLNKDPENHTTLPHPCQELTGLSTHRHRQQGAGWKVRCEYATWKLYASKDVVPLDPWTLKSLGVKVDHLAHAGHRSWQEWHCIGGHHCFEQRGGSLLFRNSITEERWIIRNLLWTGRLNSREIRSLSICLVCCQKQLIGELILFSEKQGQNTGIVVVLILKFIYYFTTNFHCF